MMTLHAVGKVRSPFLARLKSLVAQAGFEPTRADAHQRPKLERLPFRHCAACDVAESGGITSQSVHPTAFLLFTSVLIIS